jgi:hypothetical protein
MFALAPFSLFRRRIVDRYSPRSLVVATTSQSEALHPKKEIKKEKAGKYKMNQ